MACNRIVFQNRTKYAVPVTSLEEYLALRNSAANVENLRKARQGNKRAKMSLLQINYSGHYPDGRVRGCRLPAAAYVFDIDNVEDFERVAPILIMDPDKYGLLMLERSVSQGGHAVLRRTKGRTILECQVALATELRCEMDTNSHDINRVLFTTSAEAKDLLYVSSDLFADGYDEGAVAEEASLLAQREADGAEEVPKEAHSAKKHFKPWEAANDSQRPIANSQQPAAEDKAEAADDYPVSDNYLGIPYREIIDTWWMLNNEGNTPIKSNRDVLTFELAFNLRHICGFNRKQLAHVIPCYDGFTEAQKMKCIDSALQSRRSPMTVKLRECLQMVRKSHLSERDIVTAFDEAQLADDNFYSHQLPQLPMGLCDSVGSVGEPLALPVLFAVFPVIGMLATRVKLDVHGTANTLNLISYIAGEFASGKGSLDPVVMKWLEERRNIEKDYHAQEQEWRKRKKAATNTKEQPEEVRLPIRIIPLNNTVANLADRLSNTQGEHAFSFTPEADTVALKWKSAMSDFSVMVRQSYDGSPYEREAKSVDAVNVHIDRLLWNIVMCGTPDALYRVVNNYTDGFQSRIAIARTPDNTYSPLSAKPRTMTADQGRRIMQVAHLLPLMEGTLVLEKLEAAGAEWLEKERINAIANDDRVLARSRFRTCVTVQRMVGCVILCEVAARLIAQYGLAGAEHALRNNPGIVEQMAQEAQTEEVLSTFGIFADYMTDNAMAFFHDRIEHAMNDNNYSGVARSKKGLNDSIYGQLSKHFNVDQAYGVMVRMKGNLVTKNTVAAMLRNWKRQGLIMQVARGEYEKLM